MVHRGRCELHWALSIGEGLCYGVSVGMLNIVQIDGAFESVIADRIAILITKRLTVLSVQ